mmetsp:Transcript_37823/g.88506  ORF Transcript_37823/g.88506 Transcript_37823/m.88506 type:complete len:87 (-) Transcript_37823:500-760(-)
MCSPTINRVHAAQPRVVCRLLSPVRDTKNAADFVLAFWVGWLHAELPQGTRFVLLTTDIHLDRTVGDLLRAQRREALSNPEIGVLP